MIRWLLALALSASSLLAAELKVATLHPLLSDLARQVGGDRVEVIDLLGKNGDPHHFEPSPKDLQAASDARLFLASGKGLETYLPSLRSLLPAGAKLVEIGETLPSIEGACDHEGHDHHHHEHAIDPHWWHSVENFRRAASVTAETFAEADPAGAETYRQRALAYRQQLDELERWTRVQIARIPPQRRVLATAHAAFGYFCEEFGFKPLPVQGLNREQMPDPNALAKLIDSLREEDVAAIFPETSSNPKILSALTAETGIQLARPLIADGTTVPTYDEMVRHNVSTIVQALKP